MAYCGPKGIPLSTFLSWPDEDQQAALAWQSHEGKRHTCGTHAEDWTGPDGRRVEAVHFVEQACPGCAALERAREALTASKDGTRGVGLVAHTGPRSACTSCNKTT